jgi:hypothetical protein
MLLKKNDVKILQVCPHFGRADLAHHKCVSSSLKPLKRPQALISPRPKAPEEGIVGHPPQLVSGRKKPTETRIIPKDLA